MAENITTIRRTLGDANPGYNQAILYYTQLKNIFISELRGTQKIALSTLEEQFMDEINNSLINDPQGIINENDEKLEKLYLDLEEMAKAFLEDTPLDQKQIEALKSIQKKANTGKQDIKLYMKRAHDDLQTFIGDSSILEDALKDVFISTFSAIPSAASVQGIFGLFKRALLAQISSSEKYRADILSSGRMNGYKNLFKGYYREVAATKIIESAISKVSRSAYHAVQAGEAKTMNGKQSVYDIVIGKGITVSGDITAELINKMSSIDSIFDFDVYEMIQFTTLNDFNFGVQSKLWILPDELKDENGNIDRKALHNQFYLIGGRGDLFSSFPELSSPDPTWERGWHNAVYLLSRNLIKVFGESQVLFGVRNQFIWTADLISQMHQNNLWVSFYYARGKDKDNGQPGWVYPATSNVVWSSPMYAYKNYMKSRIRTRQNKS